MIILEENFKWHLEAFASELFIYYYYLKKGFIIFGHSWQVLNPKQIHVED